MSEDRDKNMALEMERFRRSTEVGVEDLAAVVTHELRNPLNAMAGWLYLLEMELVGSSGATRRALAGLRQAVREQVEQVELLRELIPLWGVSELADASDRQICDLSSLLDRCASELTAFVQSSTDPIAEVSVKGGRPCKAMIVGNEDRLSQAICELSRYALGIQKPGALLELERVSNDSPRLQLRLRTDAGAAKASVWSVFSPPSERLSLRLLYALGVLRASGARWCVVESVPHRHVLEFMFLGAPRDPDVI